MQTSRILVLAVAAALAGCGGSDNPSGSSSTDGGLLATWHATRAQYTSVANPGLSVDTVAQGSSLTLTLDATTFVLTITDPGEAPQVTNGTWTSTRDTITLTPAGMSFSWQFDMSLNGNTLTMTGGSVEFDFNADDSFEQARLDLTLSRT